MIVGVCLIRLDLESTIVARPFLGNPVDGFVGLPEIRIGHTEVRDDEAGDQNSNVHGNTDRGIAVGQWPLTGESWEGCSTIRNFAEHIWQVQIPKTLP